MRLTTKGIQEVEEVPYGVVLWQMPDGRLISDDEGRQLMLETHKRDLAKNAEIMRKYVKDEFGIEEGRPKYVSGNRGVSDEEYESQVQRMNFGLIPDPLDAAANMEAIKRARKR